MATSKHSYKIPYVGLKIGLHKFNYNLDNSFFEQFSQSLVKNAKIEAVLLLDKKTNFFELTFKLDGWVNTLCDRCCEDYKLEITDDHKLFVKFESIDQTQNINEDVVYLIKKSCKLQTSGTPECGKDLDKYFNNKVVSEKAPIDPRWEALKKLNS